MQEIEQVRCLLGESPVWDPKGQCYYWVDILEGNIYCLTRSDLSLSTIVLEDKIGCIALSASGHLMAALSRSIVSIDPGSHRVTPLCEPSLHPNEMFNDGKLDRHGRFWVASKDIDESSAIGHLYCYHNGCLEPKVDGVIVGNGIGWTLDNNAMYFTDSPRQVIYRYAYDPLTAQLGPRQEWVHVDRGYPDGLCVDDGGRVWSAHWDGGCVSCYDPEGALLRRIDLPCQRPTSCCFGGESGDELFITSASVGLSPSPQASDGHCFMIAP